MSTELERETQQRDRDLAAPLPSVAQRVGELPASAPWAILGATAVLIGGGLLLLGRGIGLAVVAVAVVNALATYLISRFVEGPRKATDRLVTVLVTGAFLVAMAPLVSVAITVLANGLARFDVQFFTYSMRGVLGEGGGAYHAIVGTLLITAIAAVMSIPIGLLAAVYLVEYGRGRLSRAITFFVDVMTGIPSIVAGLFAFALFALFAGPGVRMGFMGSVALSVLMIPVVVRSTEEMLKIVPNELREAAYALGVPKWRTILKVVVPTSIAGIASGITLALARVIGETAPLLIAVGITTGVNLDPFGSRMATLPVFAYYSYVAPGVPREPFLDRAWTAALVLIILVMALNLAARLIARAFAPKTR
jgi:phosphate transport system permease protein